MIKLDNLNELEGMEFVRIESYKNYIYAVGKFYDNGKDTYKYYTIQCYRNSTITIQPLSFFVDENHIKRLTLLQFVDEQTRVHINPIKNEWRWRNAE